VSGLKAARSKNLNSSETRTQWIKEHLYRRNVFELNDRRARFLMSETGNKKFSYFSELKSGGKLTRAEYDTFWNVMEEDMRTQNSSRGIRNGRVLFIQDVKASTKAVVLTLLHQS